MWASGKYDQTVKQGKKKQLDFTSSRRHGSGLLEIRRFVLTTPIDHAYDVGKGRLYHCLGGFYVI